MSALRLPSAQCHSSALTVDLLEVLCMLWETLVCLFSEPATEIGESTSVKLICNKIGPFLPAIVNVIVVGILHKICSFIIVKVHTLVLRSTILEIMHVSIFSRQGLGY